MCGIAGFMYFDKDRKAEQEPVKRMTDVLHHRGPDGEGFSVNNNIALGHRRLSIIDLNTGDQPMYNDDKSVAIVFNGEIYNYIELQKELTDLGYHFNTHSDTEVIIRAYEHWGIDCQQRFNGMWAFALWDDKEQRLFLSRDRIGEKPLYYSIADNTIIFGSEIKSIFAYGVPKDTNLELLEIYLTLGYVPAPFTFYKNIHKLKPAHCIVCEDNEIKEFQYWDLPEIDEGNMLNDAEEISEEFERLLNDSVRIRMRSDVPYGAFLSGGLDSSAVVSLMAGISSFPVNTYTIGFPERKFDERSLAWQVAKKFNTNHNEHLVEQDEFEESLQKIIHHYDEPFGDSSAIPTGQVSKYASSQVKMVLTGDGGDEVLSGYTNYQGEKFASHYQRLPGWARKGVPNVLSVISKPVKNSVRYKLNRAEDVCRSSDLRFNERFLTKAAFADVFLIKEIVNGTKCFPVEEYIESCLTKCSYKDPFYKLMYLHLKLSLPDDMLAKVDRMSMAYSLETRTPFLDHRLIEYMVKVHKDIKMKGFERKSVLRNSVGKNLPEALLKAPKKGFSVPVREWFKNDGFDEKLNGLQKKLNFLDQRVVAQVIEKNKTGEKDYGNFIWMLFVLDKVMEN